MTDPADKSINRLTGWVVLGLVAALALFFGGRALFKPAPEVRASYVAYFENAGGLKVGDTVRIKGRRAGTVTDLALVQHNGQARVRVEFVIAPGEGSQWLKDFDGLPGDTALQITTPKLRGNTQISIAVGKDTAHMIPSGGEVKDARSEVAKDLMTEAREELEKFNGYIDQVLAILDGPMMEKVTKGVAEFAQRIEEINQRLAEDKLNLGAINQALVDAIDRLQALRRQVADAVSSTPAQIADLNKQVAQAEPQIDKAGKQVADVARDLGKLDSALSSLAGQVSGPSMQRAGEQLRRLSSQARASMETASSDPKTFGDMPPWRKHRQFYHGDRDPQAGKENDPDPQD